MTPPPPPDEPSSPDEDGPGRIAGRARITEHGAPEPTDRNTHPMVMVLGLVLVLGLFALGALGLGHSLGTEEVGEVEIVIVPRGEGRPAEVVQRQMERLGLFVEITYASNESAPADTVTGQMPIAGSRIEVGKLVVLTVSDGPAGVRVPSVSGLQRGAAASLLSAMGLRTTTDEVFDDDVRVGEVVSTSPDEGDRVQIGDEITLHLSKGPEPRIVPEVVGLDAPHAFALIGASELQIGRIRIRSSGDLPPGSIVSSDPPAGSGVPPSTPIDLVITPEPETVSVPDLVPMRESAATQVVSGSGLRIRIGYTSVPAGDARAGLVLAQTPLPGVVVGPGTTIEVTVARAPDPPPIPEGTAVGPAD